MHVLVLHTAPVSVPHHCPTFAPFCQFSKLQRSSQPAQFCGDDARLLNDCRQRGWAMAVAPGVAVELLEQWWSTSLSPAPQSLQHQGCPMALLPAGAQGSALPPSCFAPTCKKHFSSIRRVLLPSICTLDKMLLFLSLLISSSSFNCSLEAFSRLVAGIILFFPWRVHLLLQFTGISLGVNFNFSRDMESHVPQIIPPSILLLLLEFSEKKTQYTYLSLPQSAFYPIKNWCSMYFEQQK